MQINPITVAVRHRIRRDATLYITQSHEGFVWNVRYLNTAERFQGRPSAPQPDRHRFWQDVLTHIHPADREAVALFVGLIDEKGKLL